MNKGINRANLQGISRALYENSDHHGKCVFISHKSEDKKIAQTIAQHIMDAGIDVYIDLNDDGLQKATEENNAEQIVKHIEYAMKLSSHLLVVLSENTQKSWWVPYEIGFAKRGAVNIASIILKNVDDFPDYLKIEEKICNCQELEWYITGLSTYGHLFESNYEIANKNELLKYIRE